MIWTRIVIGAHRLRENEMKRPAAGACEFTIQHKRGMGKVMRKKGVAAALLAAGIMTLCMPAMANAEEVKAGWQKSGPVWSYYDSSGNLTTGWAQIRNKWYLFDSNGAMKTGWYNNGKNTYFFDSRGVMRTGWEKVGSKWYLFDESGRMRTGWRKVNEKWYFFADSGAMRTGWVSDGSKDYFLDASGVMQTGLVKVGSKVYYFSEKGRMLTGWRKIDGNWYYFASDGSMKTGFLEIDGKKYYFDSLGIMQLDWITAAGNKYHTDSKGALQTGWRVLDGKKYYFAEDGHMVTGKQTIDGAPHTFNANGVWIQPEVLQPGWVDYDPAPGLEFARVHTQHDIDLGLARSQCEFGWQCAEFLSNCIGKGGMKEYNDHATALHNMLAQNPQIQEIVIPLDNGYIKLENVPEGCEIAAGDPILLYCPNEKDGKPFVHSLFFVGWTEEGYAKIYCHNNRNNGGVNRWPACYACHGRLTEAHCMHIKGNSPKKNGTYPANSWMTIEGKPRHINSSGQKDVGIVNIDGAWYYFDDDGVMQTGGWKELFGARYYLQDDGKMLDGWRCIGGKWYYLTSGGQKTGWFLDGGSWYYFNPDGTMVTGSKKINGKVYEFSKNGVCTNP